MFSFSLLITVYAKTEPQWFDRCLQSVYQQVDYLPNEVVVVEDGPIGLSLDQVIQRWNKKLPLRLVCLADNLGAGGAAAAGLNSCKMEWVARLDADDIALKDRFKAQIAYLRRHPEVDVLSGYLVEFSHQEEEIDLVKKVPLSHQAIASRLLYRSPINNSCVIFRRYKANQAGGYEPLTSHEDYLLWVKMLRQGAIFANLPRVLIKVRMGRDAYSRRSGFKAAKQEIIFQNRLLSGNYISPLRYLANILLRVSPRLLPVGAIKIFYRLFLRS